jgi:hypothetical protein
MLARDVRSHLRTYAIEYEKGYISEEEYVNLLLNLENEEIEANNETELREVISTIENLIDIVKHQITT